jgi:hypothetical protein
VLWSHVDKKAVLKGGQSNKMMKANPLRAKRCPKSV